MCPICLETKLCCPVITKCGHIFCYPCIISLYNYHTNVCINKKIPNCPLCNKILELGDDANYDNLKLCRKIDSSNYNNNMKMRFNLILREKKSPTLYNLIDDPSLSKWKNNYRNKMRDIPDEQTKVFNFSRIFSTNKQIMNKVFNLYKSELSELKTEFDETSDELKKESIQYCIDKIDSLILKNKNKNENILPKAKNNNFNKYENNEDDSDCDYDSDMDVDVDLDYKKYCLFYQEEKGDIYYLAPFLMEILLTEYGDYNSLPVELEGNILDIEMYQVTPKLKSEYNYLNHLRVGSIIFFVEIDINDLISDSTKEKYNEKLFERKRFRNLLKNQEKNYELFITKKNSKIIEEEKNSSINGSQKSLENISGPLFFGTDEELGKNGNNKGGDDRKEDKSMKDSKLKLLFIEKEKKEKEEKEKQKEKEEKEKEKEKEEKEKKEKKNKNKKGGNKNKKKKDGKGKKMKKSDIKEKVFNQDEDNFSESDH